jgi:hypothetical protein
MNYYISMLIFVPIMLVSIHFLIKDALAFITEETTHKDTVTDKESETSLETCTHPLNWIITGNLYQNLRMNQMDRLVTLLTNESTLRLVSRTINEP